MQKSLFSPVKGNNSTVGLMRSHIWLKSVTNYVPLMFCICVSRFWAQNWLTLPKEFYKVTEIDMNMRKDERFKIAPLSEFYEDLLRADAFLARNTLPGQAKSLLQSYLGQKQSKIHERITYLAEKRNISFKEMWQQIQNGTVQELSKKELVDLQDDGNDED